MPFWPRRRQYKALLQKSARPRPAAQAGFTLLEVVIAVAILGVSLTVLLQSQAASLNNAGRSRDLTVATLLARGKMIDVEKHLFHDGFQMSTEDEEGDFTDEGHPDYKWHTRISEVEFDLSKLMDVCGSMGGKGGGSPFGGSSSSGESAAGNEAASCESILGSVSAMLGGFTDQLGRSLRAVELTVSWADGKYKQSTSVRALLSRDDFNTEQEGEAQKGVVSAVQQQLDAGNPAARPAAGGVR
jgi:general secretion pathway protein I